MVVPSRGRPGNVRALVDAWAATTDPDAATLMVAVDDDDPEFEGYRLLAVDKFREPRPWLLWHVAPRLRLAGTLNAVAAAHAPQYKAVGFQGDDHLQRTPGWADRFMAALTDMGTGVVYANDLLQGEAMCTQVAMTSDIPLTLGYFCPPGITHLCLDLAWKDWGQGIDRLAYLDDVVIEHMHPAAQKAPLDAGYVEVNSSAQVAADSQAYYAYRDGGGLTADLDKLRALIGQAAA